MATFLDKNLCKLYWLRPTYCHHWAELGLYLVPTSLLSRVIITWREQWQVHILEPVNAAQWFSGVVLCFLFFSFDWCQVLRFVSQSLCHQRLLFIFGVIAVFSRYEFVIIIALFVDVSRYIHLGLYWVKINSWLVTDVAFSRRLCRPNNRAPSRSQRGCNSVFHWPKQPRRCHVILRPSQVRFISSRLRSFLEYPWTSSNIGLIDKGPASPFQGRSYSLFNL